MQLASASGDEEYRDQGRRETRSNLSRTDGVFDEPVKQS